MYICLQVLIHSLGDDKLSKDFPHGNQKKHIDRNYCKQCPSMKDSLQAEISRSSPAELYKAQVASATCHPSHMNVFVPRDLKMVHYKCFFMGAIYVTLAIAVISMHEEKVKLYTS